jgi:hypothetical protein
LPPVLKTEYAMVVTRLLVKLVSGGNEEFIVRGAEMEHNAGVSASFFYNLLQII